MRIMKTMGLWLFDHWQQHFLEHLGDYVPSGNGLRTGKTMRASSQRCRKNSLQWLERPALRDEFRESWGEDLIRDEISPG